MTWDRAAESFASAGGAGKFYNLGNTLKIIPLACFRVMGDGLGFFKFSGCRVLLAQQ